MGQGPTRGYGQRPPVVMPAPTDCFPAPHASRSPRIWAAGGLGTQKTSGSLSSLLTRERACHCAGTGERDALAEPVHSARGRTEIPTPGHGVPPPRGRRDRIILLRLAYLHQRVMPSGSSHVIANGKISLLRGI